MCVSKKSGRVVLYTILATRCYILAVVQAFAQSSLRSRCSILLRKNRNIDPVYIFRSARISHNDVQNFSGFIYSVAQIRRIKCTGQMRSVEHWSLQAKSTGGNHSHNENMMWYWHTVRDWRNLRYEISRKQKTEETPLRIFSVICVNIQYFILQHVTRGNSQLLPGFAISLVLLYAISIVRQVCAW